MCRSYGVTVADVPPEVRGAPAPAVPAADVQDVLDAISASVRGPVLLYARASAGRPLVAVAPAAEAVHDAPGVLARLSAPGAALVVPSRQDPAPALDAATAALLRRHSASALVAAAVGTTDAVDGALVVLDVGRARPFAKAEADELAAASLRLGPLLDAHRHQLLLLAEERRRHAMEARARGARNLAELLGSSVGAAAVAFDAAGTCTTVAGRAARAVLRHPEPVGRPLADVLVPEPAVLTGLEAALAGGASMATILIGDDVLELRWTPRVNDDGAVTGGVLVALDASAAQRAVDALRRSAEEVAVESHQRAEALERLASAGQVREASLQTVVHDDVLQLLSAVGWRLDAAAAKGSVGSAEDLRELAAQVREAAQRLGAVVDDAAGAEASLAELAPLLEARSLALLGRDVEQRLLDELDAPVPQEVAEVLVAIAADALDNVARHAAARAVELTVRAEDAGVAVIVRDDGDGFDPAAGIRRGSRGIQVMRERARTAGGWVRLDSRPGRGTTVHAWVPLR